MKETTQTGELKSTSYEIFILLLSLLSIFNLAVLLIPGISLVIKQVIAATDVFITIIFMLDFLYRLFTAESKRAYFFRHWGWADFLASLPVQQLKIFRIFRIVRVIRLLRVVGGRKLWHEMRYNRAGSALYLTIFLVLLLLEFGGIAIVYTEADAPGANIKSAADAIWWGYVTITTVGYGDLFPVTNSGRLVSMLVMTAGVALFGVITGFLANAFLMPEGEESAERETALSEIHLAEIRRLLEDQEGVNDALLTRLENIEKLLETEGQ
jgi:voltage-gated potassium channel